MAGEIDEQSQAIGQLQAGLESLREEHRAKAIKDEDFRKAGYRAFQAMEHITKVQADHAVKIEQHDRRLDGHDRSRSWAKGVIAAVGVVGSIIGTGAGLLVQFFTGGGASH
jgi:type IV secretory pathway VirD2 relaxase